jgi:hypothetical protein
MTGICSVFMHKINDKPNFSNQNDFFFLHSDAKSNTQSALGQF